MSPQRGRDGDRGVQPLEFGFVELDAVPVFECENDFHMLERVPLRDVGTYQRDAPGTRRHVQNLQQERLDLGLHLGMIAHCTTSMRIAEEDGVCAETVSKGTATASVSSSTSAPAYRASQSRAGAFRGPFRTANITVSGAG
jgi:hypothetical protein